jgi:endonuclease/exonuclease/phosphatase family metal-dependent hydrolase
MFRVLSLIGFGLGVLALSVWILGRLASDRWVWSQFIFWIPTVVVVPGAVAAFVGSRLCGLLARFRSGRREHRLRLVAEACLLGVIAYMVVIEWRVYRLPLGPRPSGAHLRVLSWNATAVQQLDQIINPLTAADADIAILVNPHSHVGWGTVQDTFKATYRYENIAGIVVMSRVPELRRGMAWLGLEGLPPETVASVPLGNASSDPGRAMFVEFDTSAQLGHSTVIWVLDLPSDPRLSRWKICEHAASVIASWQSGDGGRGFPAPDIVLGDFNTTPGSAALKLLTPGMRSAFAEAGAGYGATWPGFAFKTPVPLLQLDHMFLGSRVRAVRYQIVWPIAALHLVQVGDLVGVDPNRGVQAPGAPTSR